MRSRSDDRPAPLSNSPLSNSPLSNSPLSNRWRNRPTTSAHACWACQPAAPVMAIGCGHRNWLYRVSSSTKRLSHTIARVPMACDEMSGQPWLPEVISKYAFGPERLS